MSVGSRQKQARAFTARRTSGEGVNHIEDENQNTELVHYENHTNGWRIKDNLHHGGEKQNK